ncbi:nicotinate phosphoribosyltransferase [Clostridium acetobutylicum]|uniref:Nicotinate phosphoribosyltransferase n=1 Tax=Clostridium acetobutylicum (strain ATCC 824 / DSM 792 / JCM 1419 / IAM 19013 / LMG 5710 / NBRC 13948 / NRRL B-527 / VKM B-1787 / 2291 / W) TaxID=272562 RepID=Q97I73_CLOAB|nr:MULTISPECIES: nicotinate phosphoribosyltransferase [Clostridium]AAK79745.1 Nicotinic acid phosphoribosyltransferase [Clostridium acetobutylicum ATCC 824]ADZ20830.1 nicotinate phosphoribosyltransferase [Clostridium acetobutylicum EA 2018]AEI33589.1 nicotinate phosphoribosyltransferase [Clostridium acetobutylicum DSM 1731]AWV79820.1 nicotinate phosphoribosyltransferase [Clostridium acetobutylicum]MBC2394198.1 nicotinate phosphoribosyltransferase [Clostridium acetobutylicum]
MNKIKKFNVKDDRNLSMLMDFYELTMANGYLLKGFGDKIVYFDVFYRKNPDGAGFAIAAGLQQIIDYIKNLKFSEEDIEYLKEKNMFSEDFLKYMKNFRFSGSINAIPEGTPVFPNEALITVKAKAIEAQLIETMLLITINHECLIATKTNRIVRAAKGRPVLEFGARRAQGYDGAVYGARASYIGGAAGTATTLSEQMFNVPASGTMAHSWIQFFGDEFEAFKAYAEIYPDACTLLVDTYNVLESGIPNAIKVAKEVLEPMGKRLKGIRLDSGDLAYLSKKVRKILNASGLEDCKIVVSNSLDEYIIEDLIAQGAKIDVFGVGERMITAKSDPVFGGVYKLVAVEEDGQIVPRIKLSENAEKITNPGYKTPWRLYDKETGKAIADVITLAHEKIDENKEYTIFDQENIWKKKKITKFVARKLQVPVFIDGECVYESPTLEESREYCEKQLDTLWDEVKRFVNPHKYYVDLSMELWHVKQELIQKYRVK